MNANPSPGAPARLPAGQGLQLSRRARWTLVFFGCLAIGIPSCAVGSHLDGSWYASAASATSTQQPPGTTLDQIGGWCLLIAAAIAFVWLYRVFDHRIFGPIQREASIAFTPVPPAELLTGPAGEELPPQARAALEYQLRLRQAQARQRVALLAGLAVVNHVGTHHHRPSSSATAAQTVQAAGRSFIRTR